MPFQLTHAGRIETIQPGNAVVIETLDKKTRSRVVRSTTWLSTARGAARRTSKHGPDKLIEPKRRKTIRLGFEETIVITPLPQSHTRELPPYDAAV